jgi:enoyl-CoA hydratase/carnithine racemase
MTANYEHLIVGLLDGIATVELSRPPVNAVSMQMYGEIYSLFSDIDQLGDVRAVVLLGRGDHFCDFIVAAEDALFGTPQVGVGVMGVARHLSRLIPQGHTRMLYYTAEPIGARQMHALGAVVEVVGREELSVVAHRYARNIARHSPVVLRSAKQALNTVEDMNLAHGYEYEQGLTVALADHPHSREARRATLARRSPDYADLDASTGSSRSREDHL